jgi:hypothetical protein
MSLRTPARTPLKLSSKKTASAPCLLLNYH